MNRPICDACGGIAIDPATVIVIHPPSGPAEMYTTCADCAGLIVRRLTRRSDPETARPAVELPELAGAGRA